MLLYLAATYKEYVEECKLNLYGTAPVKIPRPELYVVYTGDRTDVPEALRLSDLYEGTGTVDVEVKALRGNGTGDIVDQYVRFCRISDEERKKHGRSRKAIEETLRRCMEEKVLAPFLATRQKEVAEIMVTLFDQEKIMELHDYHIAEGARKDGLQAGTPAGTRKGAPKGAHRGPDGRHVAIDPESHQKYGTVCRAGDDGIRRVGSRSAEVRGNVEAVNAQSIAESRPAVVVG